jgi:F0F1-type ATP synthase membrane subunit c/vacuolar-type H+-ATPase subunit K
MQIRNKLVLITAAIMVGLTALSGGMYNSKLGQYQQTSVVNNGSATCFQRISQTFTAIMVRDFTSLYLSRDFTEMTAECFSEVMGQFKSVYGEDFKKAHRPLNDLLSDGHWFHEKVFRHLDKGQAESDVAPDANLIQKYANLEGKRADFQDAMDARVQEIEASSTMWKWMTIGFLLFSVGVLGFFFYLELERVRAWMGINQRIEDLSSESNDVMIADVDRLMEDAFNIDDQNKAYQFFNNHFSSLLESSALTHSAIDDMRPVEKETVSVEDIPQVSLEVKKESQPNEIPDVPTPTSSEETVEVVRGTDFNEAFLAIFNRVKDRAFANGVVIDFDMNEDLHVELDKESLSQLLMSAFGYAISASARNQQINKIMIRTEDSKDEVQYNFSIQGHFFNVSELEYLAHNGSASGLDSTDLMILKELVAEVAVGFKATNKIGDTGKLIGANFELSLKKATPQKSQKVVRVVKGKKSEVLSQMSN